tara:strand:- start:309 stop:512 length:204 start_codon:yes stop_codon:yes gene_type:complete
MRHSVTIENIDAKLLFEQKCDLLDVIGFLESLYEKYPRSMEHLKKKITSLDGVINMLDTISDQIEKD